MPTPANAVELLRRIAHQTMLDHQMEPDFPAAALQAVQALQGPAPVSPGEAAHRDLRELLWVSIDNDDSRDLDQLSVAEVLVGSQVRVRVAIADVDALVHAGSPIDVHARLNTTSVYTAAQVFPMLPLRLSTDLTSLGQGQERWALVVDMTVDDAGNLVASDIYRALVVNQAKLAYRQVSAWLDGTATPGSSCTQGAQPARRAPAAPSAPLLAQLRLQQQVAERLRQVRHRQGALVLASLEANAVFEGSALRDLQRQEKNVAMDLIEDLMVAANGVTARFLASRGQPSLRRVLRTPEHWDRLVALAQGLGDSLPPEPSATALSELLQRRQQLDPDGFADLSLAVIKLLGRGEYVVESPGEPAPGHFGLAVQDYTHSTAPNRRYPDLIVQRLLKAALAGTPAPYAEGELDSLATHCTVQEDQAAKVERRVAKSAAALLLSDRVGQRFDAIVTGAADKGTWVRIDSPLAEGRLIAGEAGLQVGDRLRVTLVRTDVERGFIDFKRAS